MMGPIADTLIQGSLTQFYSGTARSLNKGLAGRIGKVTKLDLNCKVKKIFYEFRKMSTIKKKS